MNGLLRSPKGATKAGPRGRLICHSAGKPSYQQGGIMALVLQGLQAAETSWIATWRTRIVGRDSVIL